MTTAIGQYVADVKSSDFPNEKNSINHLLKPPLSLVSNEFGSRLSS
jgi:hypothetical protein